MLIAQQDPEKERAEEVAEGLGTDKENERSEQQGKNGFVVTEFVYECAKHDFLTLTYLISCGNLGLTGARGGAILVGRCN